MTPFDASEWQARVRGDSCALCRQVSEPEKHGHPIATLPSGTVFLQDDGDFRGYCILVYRRHVVELFDLSESERHAFVEDGAAVARAVSCVTGALKINYAMLGNLAPHLHLHVIPRTADDGWWGQSPWARPDSQKRALPVADLAALREKLTAAIESACPPPISN